MHEAIFFLGVAHVLGHSEDMKLKVYIVAHNWAIRLAPILPCIHDSFKNLFSSSPEEIKSCMNISATHLFIYILRRGKLLQEIPEYHFIWTMLKSLKDSYQQCAISCVT